MEGCGAAMPRLILILFLLAPAAPQPAAVAGRLARHRNLGKAFFENPTTHNEAVAEFKQALDLAPDSARDRLNYGLALLAAGKTAEGVAEIERVQKQDPKLPHTWFNLGIQYKKAGDFERATAQLEQMARLAPQEPVTRYNLGVLYKLAGRNADAAREFELASKIEPNLAAPHFQLYNLYRQMGKREEAAARLAQFQAAKKRNESAPVPEDMEWSFYSEVYELIPATMITQWPEPSKLPPFSGDADNDGKLDRLVLTAAGADLLLTRPGAPRRFALPVPAAKYRTAVWLDYDHDYDLDLFLLGEKSVLLRNQGDAGWVDRSADFPFAPGTVTAAAAFRVIADTKGIDLAVAYQDRAGVLYRDRMSGRFEAAPLGELPAGTTVLEPVDANNDGAVDLYLGAKFLLNRDGKFEAALPPSAPKAQPGPNWIEVTLQGVKNLKLGEGAEVEIKAGMLYAKKIYRGAPLRFALGKAAQIDQLRITWPNGLIQSQAKQAVNRRAVYKEAQRLSGSCPQVFTWNGREFEYITDVLGVAPLGAAAGNGRYFAVDHEEAIVIPGGALRPRGGRLEIRLTEELSEVAYIDGVRLMAVDVPPGAELLVNEKFQPPPFGAMKTFASGPVIRPVKAVDHRGRDVLNLILKRDRRYPDAFVRTEAGVAEPHWIEIEFARMDAPAPALVLHGWVDWADGSTFLGVAQRGVALALPRLEAFTDGRRVTVMEEMGMPAGKPKTIAVELDGKLPAGTTRLRIATNLALYWDEVYLTSRRDVRQVQPVPLASASLGFRGFSRAEIHPGRKQPERFFYARPLPESMWNPTPGMYTRFGAVEELLDEADDRFVIMGSGDELSLSFDASSLPAAPAGSDRHYVLVVDGWAKDRDANTAHSQTVEPLPFHGMSGYPYAEQEQFPSSPRHNQWRRDYNTRPALRLVRPLRHISE
jgi:tetratricopeptide (TPR) repeat protein